MLNYTYTLVRQYVRGFYPIVISDNVYECL